MVSWRPQVSLDDGEQLSTHVGVDAVALGEEDGAGVLHGIGGVVALGGVVGVVGEEVDGLLALEVDEAHTAALGRRPWPSAGRAESLRPQLRVQGLGLLARRTGVMDASFDTTVIPARAGIQG